MKVFFKFPQYTILFFLCWSISLTAQTKKSDVRIEFKIDSILDLMTLEEKIGQMNQYNGSWEFTGPPNGRRNQMKLENLKRGVVGSFLNITDLSEVREAQRLNLQHSRLKIPLLFGYDVIHGYKTIFPIPLGESASWDLDLIENTAAIAAKEAAASGINWTFAPMIDVSRDARWGRIMEGSGEDPYLTSRIAVARVKGFQGTDLSDPTSIAACAKHLAGYGLVEGGKDYNTVNIGIHELHNSILPPFKAVAEEGVATMMNSFNEIDGIPATASEYLQREIVKENWSWDGFIVSDWASIRELQVHGVAKNSEEAAFLAIKAGCDMDMDDGIYERHLYDLVKKDQIEPDLIDDAVRRILRLKFRLGLFDDPYRYGVDGSAGATGIDSGSALEAARRSIVLLKNENQILPIKKSLKRIAVIGPLAADKDSPLGNWRAQAEPNSAVSVLEGIRDRAGSEVEILYAKGIDLVKGERGFQQTLDFNLEDLSGMLEAERIAKKADLVILVVGEDAFQSGEGRSQANIGFRGLQDELINRINRVNRNIVMVLMNGRPMDLTPHHKVMKGIVETWFLGSQHGNAVADILFGKVNPSGKLPVSFPHDVGQEPLYYNHKNTGRPSGKNIVTFSQYTDTEEGSLFPFGFGLSYTTFRYSNVRLSNDHFGGDNSIIATVDVKNVGDLPGEEVVQLYLRDKVGSITRPIKELKGFEKVHLKPGESKRVSFKIDRPMLSFFTKNKKWEAEAGEFDLFLGGSSTTQNKITFNYGG